ncbi:MAG: MarR family transcriptional regulator [Verrucomicrobiae bacterium]|nr:MarR family transcriptional regulator [Verrucomicrobiae bacterium]
MTLPPMSKADYEKLAAFRYELRRFLRFSEQAAKEHGLAPMQYLALLAIEGFPGRDRVTVGELAERLQVAAHTAVGLVDRLEAAGLAKRLSVKSDRRQVHVTLTAQGRSRLEKLAALHRQEIQTTGVTLVRELSLLLERQPDRHIRLVNTIS